MMPPCVTTSTTTSSTRSVWRIAETTGIASGIDTARERISSIIIAPPVWRRKLARIVPVGVQRQPPSWSRGELGAAQPGRAWSRRSTSSLRQVRSVRPAQQAVPRVELPVVLEQRHQVQARPDRRGSLVAVERGSAVPAGQLRREGPEQLVDQAGVEKCLVQARAALGQQRPYPVVRAQVLERSRQ